MKVRDRDHYELSTGRVFSANCGIIGIAPDLHVREGYDGGIDVADGADWKDPKYGDDEAHPWTQAEREELADFMIELWGRFKIQSHFTKETP